jgi:hypothetical protein
MHVDPKEKRNKFSLTVDLFVVLLNEERSSDDL